MLPVIDPAFFAGRRTMALCNACGYCEGYCPVFDQGRHHPALADADLVHLAFLCHDCGACRDACQYAPPHHFAIDVPNALRDLRTTTHQSIGLPLWMGPRRRCSRWRRPLPWIFTAAVVALLLGLPWRVGIPDALARIAGSTALSIAGSTLCLWMVLWSGHRARRYWQTIADGRRFPLLQLPIAFSRGATWHYVGNGHGSCGPDQTIHRLRPHFHRLLVLGFLLCFLATLCAGAYQHVLRLMPFYPLDSLPVLLGLTGGFLVAAGVFGMILSRPKAMRSGNPGPDLTMTLLAVSVSGLILLAFRSSGVGLWRPAPHLALILHLAVVAALFILAPFSQLMHVPFRILSIALMLSDVRNHLSSRTLIDQENLEQRR